MSSPQVDRWFNHSYMPTANSSVSSLAYSEEDAPPFQTFVKRTPPVLDTQRALPPLHSTHQTPSSSRSRTPLRSVGRRSSSVYSRPVSWHSEDFADIPAPPLPILQPLAYSASTPHLAMKLSTSPALQPRKCSPLIDAPSPIASPVVTPLAVEKAQSATAVPRGYFNKNGGKTLKTVPLERAMATLHAPGAAHLLPEEHRAQKTGRSRSHEPLRIALVNTNLPTGSPQLPGPPTTLVDTQGRRRTLLKSPDGWKGGSGYSFPEIAAKIKPARQDWAFQNVHETPPGVDSDQRGRTMERGRRRSRNVGFPSRSEQNSMQASSTQDTRSQRPAEQFLTLTPEQRRYPSIAPSLSSAHSDDETSAHMRLVPRPLFQIKPPAKLPGEVYSSRQEEEQQSLSSYQLSSPSQSSYDATSITTAFSSPQSATHRRMSTSGSIRISPPLAADEGAAQYHLPVTMRKTAKPKSAAQKNRASAYYPHVAPRKGKVAKTGGKARTKRDQAPPMPVLSNNDRQLASAAARAAHSPLRVKRAEDVLRDGSPRRTRDTSPTDTSRPRLHQRIVNGAARYAGFLTKPTDSDGEEAARYQPITIATISPISSNLSSSPVNSIPTSKANVHLGWSDLAKTTFDRVVSPGLKPPAKPERQHPSIYTHITTAARPLDASRAALVESPESPTGGPRRKSSIFGGFLESWKESKEEKRREELKRIIRVVPSGTTSSSQQESVVETPAAEKPKMASRRSSAFGWM
ncbi:hypothetical protein BDY17DRAFT_324631 [Neohortaea acidophila]|uniref:Uncharacterized protein n=1 Tax=Neohortaea acidophila TaxID=245834 RepID=A0A6A6PQQ5_9PEZI|nr:uncharacterized protein BDY17DRAFT_324631 [Neohortaea acidophila]KAF2482342.1 hypothetical protein BDY17DRAFT_324631 [Neohortaea acidophila]